jgi:hypothetical protein
MKTVGTILMIVVGFFFNSSIDTKAPANTFAARQTVEVINNAKGEIRKIGDEDIYMIYCKEKHLKLNAFDLPEKFKKPGLNVTFSGNIKTMDAMEDEWGELFEVTAIN